MKYIFPIFLSGFFLFSCGPLGIGRPIDDHLPTLGDIGKPSPRFSGKGTGHVGSPALSLPIALSLREVPFTKKKFREYAAIQKGKGREIGISFIDSLPVKPKYIFLEISDRIALTGELNADRNHGVREYLSRDPAHGIVTSISAVGDSRILERLIASDGIFLTKGRNGLMGLEVVKANSRESVPLAELDVFAHEMAGFCWGLDRYGVPRIEAIVPIGTACPQDTERKAYRLDRTKPYFR